MPRPFISLCMIVKNEAQVLHRCLDASYGLWDELIVVDTGSEDATIDIARSYGAYVLHYAWTPPGHKGEARNVGIDAANGSWIVILDADEVVRNAADFRTMIYAMPDQATAGHVRFENYGDNGEVVLSWTQPRFFRRGLYRYVHREHEVPIWQGQGEAHEVQTPALIEHRPPKEREVSKPQPMLERLLLDAQERPDDSHALYFLHRQYIHVGDYRQCIEWGHRYLEVVGERRITDAYANLADAHACLGEWQVALDWLHRALSSEPQRRIWWMRTAQMYMELEQWNVALAYLRAASELRPADEWLTEPYAYSVGLRQAIAQCERELV